jgi:predicted N-acyltransferase
MRVETVTTVGELDLDEWDALLGPGDLYMSSPWLRIGEETADAPPLYLVVRDGDGRACAAVACYPLDVETPYPFCRLDWVLSRAGADPQDAQLTMPSLFAGGRFPSHTRVVFDRRRPAVDCEAALAAGLEAVEDAAVSQGLPSFGILYVDERDEILRRALDRRGLLAFASGVASSLDVPPAFDDYLARLSGPRRNAIRRNRRKLVELGANVSAKYGTPYDPEAMHAWYDVLLRHFPEGALVGSAEVDGGVCGFVLLLRWRDELYARQVGFDYDLKGELPAYFGVVFYEPIEYAIREGIARIDYATGAVETKRAHGCVQWRQHTYARCFDAALHERLARSLEL